MVQPPAPSSRPSSRLIHGRTLDDDLDWLRDIDDPDTRAYLSRENDWTAQATAHLAGLREAIYSEIDAHTQQTDLSVPQYSVDTAGRRWWYYSRTTTGSSYSTHYRAPAQAPDDIPDLSGDLDGERIVLDVNAEADGHDFFSLGDMEVSPDGDCLVWSVDTIGDELYAVHVRDLATGVERVDLPTQIGSVCWLGDHHLLYTVLDDAWRPHRVLRHHIGQGVRADTILLTEPDERFWVGIGESGDGRWVLIASGSKTSSEYHLLPVSDPMSDPILVRARQPGVEYDVEPAGDRLLIVHNGDDPDFCVASAPLTDPARWTTVLPGREGVRILSVDAYAGYVVVTLRRDGLPAVMVIPRTADGELAEGHDVDPGAGLTSVFSTGEDWFETDRIRVIRESYTQPAVVSEHLLATGEERVLKRQVILPGPDGRPFDPSRYVAERVWATAGDGTRIPISVVRRTDVDHDATAPGLLYGYGAYETSMDPGFSIPRLSLLDRGVVVAYAHIRGGGEFGRRWYEQGRLENKPTTFTDFVACAACLIDTGIVARDRLAARGFSAGGLTIGAAVNLAPDLFRAVHVGVGFVDPLTSMLDPSLPLTVTEWDEWGDPLSDPAAYDLMASYSPYLNVRPVRYPAVLATGSVNDQRVSFAEPAKWAAQLRRTALSDPQRPVLLRIDLVGGHGGSSGRYAMWREEASELAWLLDALGATTVV